MDDILEHVSDSNKSWVSGLTPKNIADILNMLSVIPFMKERKYEDISEIAANIGKRGESEFENIVDEFLPSDYKLQNVAKTGKCGDFILSWCSHKTNRIYRILIELKNYRNTVPNKEVEKFYRDLRLNQVDCGLLLSLNSKIIGISKIIEFKELITDNKKIPVIFTYSKTPELIAEIIKLAFHTVEIKDQNENKIENYDNLIIHVNSLSESVEAITQCRDQLQISKQTIEQSMNKIMCQLMGCEYDLVNKIRQIQSTLQKPISIPDAINPDILIVPIDVVKNVMKTFGHTLDVDYEEYMYSIYNQSWNSYNINIPKKQWELQKIDNMKMIVKFNKKTLYTIFPTVSNDMVSIIKNIPSAKVKFDGTHIPINEQTINYILEICNLL